MQITLNTIGKRYNYEWIFRNVNYDFTENNSYVILGSNGSGKSTLLQVILGSIIPSHGEITYNHAGASILPETIFKSVSFASPYMEVYEEFTLLELIEFHAKFKPFIKNIDFQQIIAISDLEKAKNKPIKQFSSGMKQRVKLTLAILSDTPLLLLDEPTSNLDKKAIDWYQQLITNYTQNRLVIVCSNQIEHEYFFCKKQLSIEDYKQ
ncbi:MAG: ATP-binding cassette domain-containing protein [Bacteroidia bacterium]